MSQLPVWRRGPDVSITDMRTLLPIFLVLLAIFTAGCIAYVAWELSSDKQDRGGNDAGNGGED